MSEKARWIASHNLDAETVERVAPDTWVRWQDTTEPFRTIGYKQGAEIREFGDLLVQYPWNQFYNLTWGLAPSQDMPKYRWMYRARSEVRRGVDTKVMLAVGRGFKVICEDNPEIERFANDLLTKLKIRDILQSAVTDMLIYGQAYFEKVRPINDDGEIGISNPNETVTRKYRPDELDDEDPKRATDKLRAWVEDVNRIDGWLLDKNVRTRLHADLKIRSTRFRAQEEKKILDEHKESDLIYLKKLDPLWMRINRDAFGNVMGYVQWGVTTVPQSIIPERIVFLPWMPKSWSHESAYGTSILMPIQRHISLLIQAEEDMKIFWHQYAKPMRVLKAGTAERPYPLPALTGMRDFMAKLQPTGDAVIPGDCELTNLLSATGETSITFQQYSNYLTRKIYEAIGVPNVLMNQEGQTVRASSDTLFQGFIAEEKMTQEILGEIFLEQVIIPEIRAMFGENIPKVEAVWPPIIEEDRNKMWDRLVKTTGRPYITPNEARIASGYKPMEGEEYDALADQFQPGFGQLSKGPEYSESGKTGNREETLTKRNKDNSSK